MPFKTRVFGAGKLLMLVAALVGTYFVFGIVSMRLALKTREVTVPDLNGFTPNEAMTRLARLELALNVDDARRADAKVPAGRVVTQEPGAGSTTRRQRSVRIWLSSGAQAVPTLVGDTERSAQQRLSVEGLDLAGLAEIRSPLYPADVVVAQSVPPDGARGRVALLMNRGGSGASYLMPDLVGAPGDRAAEVLRSYGLRVAVVPSSSVAGVPAGTVVRQVPQAGFQILPSEAISLEVAQ
jgi:serine/threonine-protein kinase